MHANQLHYSDSNTPPVFRIERGDSPRVVATDAAGMFCPRCGSNQVIEHFGEHLQGHGRRQVFECGECHTIRIARKC